MLGLLIYSKTVSTNLKMLILFISSWEKGVRRDERMHTLRVLCLLVVPIKWGGVGERPLKVSLLHEL